MVSLALALVLGLSLLILCCADLPVSPPAGAIQAALRDLGIESEVVDATGDIVIEEDDTKGILNALPGGDPTVARTTEPAKNIDQPQARAEPAGAPIGQPQVGEPQARAEPAESRIGQPQVMVEPAHLDGAQPPAMVKTSAPDVDQAMTMAVPADADVAQPQVAMEPAYPHTGQQQTMVEPAHLDVGQPQAMVKPTTPEAGQPYAMEEPEQSAVSQQLARTEPVVSHIHQPQVTAETAHPIQPHVTEPQCEPVTELKTALASMIEENTGLQSKLSNLTEKLEKLHGVIDYLNTTLTAFEVASADTTMAVAKLQEEHEREVESLREKLRVAERNATLYENRAHFAKNERTIARLSQDNCMLELEAARHTHFDELEALRGEIKSLRAAKPVVCAPGSGPVPKGNEKFPQLTAKMASHPSDDGVCDGNKCLNMFLSRYVFFWAKEHQDATASSHSHNSPGAGMSGTTQQSSALGRKPADSSSDAHPLPQSATAGQAGHYIRHAASAVVSLYKTYVHPALRWFVLWEVRIVAGAGALLLKGAEIVWNNVLSPLLYDTVMPAAQSLYSATLLPWYTTNIRPSVDPTVVVVLSHWDAHVVPWYEKNLLDYVDYAFGRLHYAAYFTMRFFFDGELESNLEQLYHFVAGFVPGVIDQMSSLPVLHEQLGDNCDTVVTVVVYSVMALFLYFIRRFIIGVLALLLMLVLSPVLLTVYCAAKLVRLLMPKKKSTKKGSSKASGGGPRSGSKSSGAVSPPGQVSALPARQHGVPMTAPPMGGTAGGAASRRDGRGPPAGIAERPPSQVTRSQRGVQFDEQNDQHQAPASRWGAYEP